MLHIFVMYSEMNRIICSKFTHSKIKLFIMRFTLLLQNHCHRETLAFGNDQL